MADAPVDCCPPAVRSTPGRRAATRESSYRARKSLPIRQKTALRGVDSTEKARRSGRATFGALAPCRATRSRRKCAIRWLAVAILVAPFGPHFWCRCETIRHADGGRPRASFVWEPALDVSRRHQLVEHSSPKAPSRPPVGTHHSCAESAGGKAAVGRPPPRVDADWGAAAMRAATWLGWQPSG